MTRSIWPIFSPFERYTAVPSTLSLPISDEVSRMSRLGGAADPMTSTPLAVGRNAGANAKVPGGGRGGPAHVPPAVIVISGLPAWLVIRHDLPLPVRARRVIRHVLPADLRPRGRARGVDPARDHDARVAAAVLLHQPVQHG